VPGKGKVWGQFLCAWGLPFPWQVADFSKAPGKENGRQENGEIDERGSPYRGACETPGDHVTRLDEEGEAASQGDAAAHAAPGVGGGKNGEEGRKGKGKAKEGRGDSVVGLNPEDPAVLTVKIGLGRLKEFQKGAVTGFDPARTDGFLDKSHVNGMGKEVQSGHCARCRICEFLAGAVFNNESRAIGGISQAAGFCKGCHRTFCITGVMNEQAAKIAIVPTFTEINGQVAADRVEDAFPQKKTCVLRICHILEGFELAIGNWCKPGIHDQQEAERKACKEKSGLGDLPCAKAKGPQYGEFAVGKHAIINKQNHNEDGHRQGGGRKIGQGKRHHAEEHAHRRTAVQGDFQETQRLRQPKGYANGQKGKKRGQKQVPEYVSLDQDHETGVKGLKRMKPSVTLFSANLKEWNMKIAFIDPARPLPCNTGVGFCHEKCKLDEALSALDALLDGFVSEALAGLKYSGKRDEVALLTLPPAAGLSRLFVFGLGEDADGEEDILSMERSGGVLASRLFGFSEAVLLSSGMGEDVLASLLEGMLLRSWQFVKYRTNASKDKVKVPLGTLHVHVADVHTAQKAFAPRKARAEAVFFARDLISEPGNVLYPASMASRVAKHFEKTDVSVEILGEKDIRALGMGALLGVAQGSEKPPRLVVMEYHGAKKGSKKPPVAFVGKGVTFDSGGISLKPGAGMWDMKHDMAGAAAVIGVMDALAARKAKVDVVGIVGLVENMPSGGAQRPGDIVVSMSGQTIEVQNTDAEGRLVLADCLSYAQERFGTKTVVNLATLTGAIAIALGSEHAGLFSNSTELAGALRAAGKKTGERLWRLPMGSAYDKMIDSDIADMKNITGVRDAGSITAAQFLQRFVREDVAWAHLDIASVAWKNKDDALCPKGATGFGVRLLDVFVAAALEKA